MKSEKILSLVTSVAEKKPQQYLARYVLALSLLMAPAQTARGNDESWQDKVDPELLALLVQSSEADEVNSVAPSADVLVFMSEAIESASIAEETREQILSTLQSEADQREEVLESLGQSTQHCFDLAPVCLVPDMEVTVAQLSELASSADIAYVSTDTEVPLPDLVVEEPAATTAEVTAPQWNLRMVGADIAQDVGVTGEGAYVANLDSGVDGKHPALAESYSGYYFSAKTYTTTIDISPQEEFEYATSHGTATMGVMVGKGVGVAEHAKWIGIKVCGQASCLVSNILKGADWLANLVTTEKLERVVLNISLGGGSPNYFDKALKNLISLGVLPVIAAGNDGSECDTITSPGSSTESLLTVGAVSSNDSVIGMSGRGGEEMGLTQSLLVAPGSKVLTTASSADNSKIEDQGLEKYGQFTGTSLAAPHVSGAAALLWSMPENAEKTPEEIATLLKDSAAGADAPECGVWEGGNNTYGHGRLDVKSILEDQGLWGNFSTRLPLISR